MYANLKKNEGWNLLTEISDLIIRKMLFKGVIAESELSHIQVDQASGLYRPEFHLTLLRAGNRPIDATKIF